MTPVYAKDIASFLGSEHVGPNVEVLMVCQANKLKPNGMSFISKPNYSSPDVGGLVFIKDDVDVSGQSKNAYIKTKNPKLWYTLALRHFAGLQTTDVAWKSSAYEAGGASKQSRESYEAKTDTLKSAKGEAELSKTGVHKKGITGVHKKGITGVHETAIVHPSVSLGEGVQIGPFSIIEEGCEIGNYTVIEERVTLRQHTKIGAESRVGAGTVVGDQGYGFAFDDEKIPYRIPHVGKVIIGNHVDIGANVCVHRGTIEDTVIENHVKIDDLVFIAHNCHIGEKTLIIATASISGSVKIGERCWIAPGVKIINGITIGHDVTLGLGAHVTKPVPDFTTVAGLPAIPFKDLVKFRKDVGY